MDHKTKKEIRILQKQYCPGSEIRPVLDVIDEIVAAEMARGNPSMSWILISVFNYGLIWGKRIERAKHRGMTQEERMERWV